MIQIIHEAKRWIALNKPSGQIVIPGRGDHEGIPLAQELQDHLKTKVYVVHRLDRGASGLVLFAKEAAMHRYLSMVFEKREMKKTYLVLVQGSLSTGGKIEQPIKAFGSGRMGVHTDGKPSMTEYAIRKQGEGATLLEVSPHTGRRHQIRVHLYSIGHPVMGDTIYGKDRPVGGAARLMLHAWKLEWTGVDGKTFTLEAPPPESFLTF